MPEDNDSRKTNWPIPRSKLSNNSNTFAHAFESLFYAIFELAFQFINTVYLYFLKPTVFFIEIGDKEGVSEKVLSPLLYCMATNLIFVLLMPEEIPAELVESSDGAIILTNILPGKEFGYFMLFAISITLIMVLTALFSGFFFSVFLKTGRKTMSLFICYTLGNSFVITGIFGNYASLAIESLPDFIQNIPIEVSANDITFNVLRFGYFVIAMSALISVLFSGMIRITSITYQISFVKVTLVALTSFVMFMTILACITVYLAITSSNQSYYRFGDVTLMRYKEVLGESNTTSVFVTTIIENRSNSNLYLKAKEQVKFDLFAKNQINQDMFIFELNLPIHSWEGGELQDFIIIGGGEKKWIMFRWDHFKDDYDRWAQESDAKLGNKLYFNEIFIKNIDDRKARFSSLMMRPAPTVFYNH